MTSIYLGTNVYSQPGDSVEEIAEYWGDSSIDYIHSRVSEWMAQAGKEKVRISSN